MQKKLLAVAVAGALASPLAMAQSAVTISGVFKVGIDNYRVSNSTRAGNKSETRVTDNSSRMIFGITEDLGGGLSGIAQLDARPQLDDAGGNFAESGNTWVGIRSTSLGTITLGRHDLHYGKQPDDTAALAGALMAASVSLMDFTENGQAIAGATRTSNVIRYDSPNWSGFAFTAAYSTNATGDEADLSSTQRKGNAWNFNPSYTTSNWQVGWSHWRRKADAPSAAGTFTLNATTGVVAAGTPSAGSADQESNSFYGFMRFGAIKVGLGINQSEVENPLTGAKTQDRRAWTVPVSWTAGPHHLAGHYTRAGDDDITGNESGANMFAIAYSYLLSKRTSVGLTYARINNDTNAAYNFFTNTGGLGSTSSTMTNGEDGRLLALTVRHSF
ncbi:MAG TPA: porin [Burkholderiales bacterium]|nr:porin [Burkholderiales bacterium]